MNSLQKTVVAGALGCMIALMGGCASSSLVEIGHDASFKSPPLGKILVIGIIKDATKRRIWEDAFVFGLTKHCNVAIPSYSLFPDALPDTNQVVATIQTNGFDGILDIRTLPDETNTHFVQAYLSSDQVERYNYYSQRYQTYYREIEHPAYIDSQPVAIRAIDIITTANGGVLIWCATSRTPDPGSVTDVQRGIVNLVISKLVQRRIIKSKK